MGVFLSSNFISQKFKISPGIHLNICKCNVVGIKLKRKMMRLHKIWAVKFSSFLRNTYAVHDF